MLQPAPSAHNFDEPSIEALVELMLLAAHADGELSDEEQKGFAASVESLTERRLSAAALDTLVARCLGAVETEGREARLASVKARLADRAARKVALSLAVRLMAADGIIRTTERELILEAADALDLGRDEVADLVKALTPQ